MRFDLIVSGGRVVSSEGSFEADIGIGEGQIAEIGDLSGRDAAETLDAGGLTILPGIIDTQVHFREPGLEHKEDLESGTRSAVLGGVTTVFEMPNTKPPTTSAEALADKLRRAEGRAWCDHAFFVGAALENLDQLEMLERLPGTPGIKIFMGSSTGSLLIEDDETLLSVLRNGKQRCAVHAEDEARLRRLKAEISVQLSPRDHPKLRDEECARLATERLIRCAWQTGRPVHILHISTADELLLIAGAKREGLDITAEVTPQHLFFHGPEVYGRLGTLAQMNPPIRSEHHQAALRNAAGAGLFDIVGSDHAPHTLEEKAKRYPESPSGMPGVQTLVPAMLTMCGPEGPLTLAQFVRMACENPARLFGIRGKGRISPGFDADLCIVDLAAKRVLARDWIASKCGWSPFEGLDLTGWPVHTVLRGQIVVRDGSLVGSPAGRPVGFDWK